MIPQKLPSGQRWRELDGESDQGSASTPQSNSQPGDNTNQLPLVGDLGTIFQPPSAAQSGSGGSSGSPSTPVSGSTSAFVINVTYDQSQSSLPAGFVAAINYVVSYYESIFTSPTTVNIDVGYGEIDGQALESGALGESETYLADYSYSTIKNALANVDPTAAASMPSGMPVSGTMWVGTAEAKALGLSLQQPSADIDGYAGFSSVYPFAYNPNNRAVSGEYDFIGVVEHEFTEVMGRIDLFGESIGNTTGYSLLDMFHYTAPGAHTYTGLTTNYFSVNGGVTNLDNFNSNPNGDLGDWAGSAGDDAYLAFSPTDEADTVSQADITEMNALGYSITAPTGIAVSGTTSEADQGGAPVALLSGVPTITDSGKSNLASATIKIANGGGSAVAGDGLYVNGQQSGTLDGGAIAVGWNATTNTLTLTGSATLATYQTLLSEVTYQDTGTDSSTGAHPVRTVTWTANDGTTNLSTTSQVAVDRAPVVNGDTGADVVGTTLTANAGAGVLSNDTDPDGDTLTVTGVSDAANGAGTVGQSLAGTYGHLTLNANGSYSYVADISSALNSVPTGSHPQDVFTYTVSDGEAGTASATLGIAISFPLPNLTEYVSVGNATVAAGGSTTVSAYAMNIGAAVAPSSTAGIYLSTDSTITTSDTLLTTVSSPGLATVGQPGYYDLQNVSVTLPGNLAPGTYYIGGIADYNDAVSESSYTDNTYNVVPINVTAPAKPNLTEYVSVGNATVAAGGSTTVSAYAMNIGAAVAPSSTAGIYLSTDSTITTSDTLLTTVSSPGLATVGQPGYYDLQNVSVTLPGNLAPGTYYIGGIADYNDAVSESSYTDNTYNVVPINVTAPAKPNLTEYVSVGNATVAAGGSTTVSAYAMNIGAAVAPSSTAGIYLSTDSTITTSDTLLTTVSSPGLATVGQPGYYDLQNVSVTLPGNLAPGTYYIGGIADYNDAVSESSYTDNTYNVVPINVMAPAKPNLTEYVSVGNATVAAGGSTTVSAYAMNIGAAVAPSSTAGIYLSTDSTITTSDTLLTTVSSPGLATVGQPGYYDLQNVSVTLPGNLAPGTYYIGGIADYNDAVSESSYTDNTYNVVPINVTAPAGASMGASAAAPATVNAGQTVELSSPYSGMATFAGETGTLELDNSSSFAGTVAGLTGQDTLDLADINFGTLQAPQYSGTSTGGALSVTDGTHSTNIALLGNYMASTFVASSDGHDGTSISDPSANPSNQSAVLTTPHRA